MTSNILHITFPHPPGAGGPGSFQIRFEKALQHEGWEITYANQHPKPNVVMVVGGTRKLFWLWKMKRKGIPIIYRLDGIVWLHKKNKVGLKYYLTAEFRNFMSKCIHGFLASKIVYQSQFVQNWWDQEGFRKRKNTRIIHNGVVIPDESFIKKALQQRKTKRLVILEGVIDYSPYAVRLLNDLAVNLPKDIQIELYGKFENKQAQHNLDSRLQYKGFLDRKAVYDVFAGSVYLSLDINPACPNTVAEALACGAPVAAFNTGALPELVDDSCGRIVDYGADPWKLAYPNLDALIDGIQDLFCNYTVFSQNAYQKAVKDYEISDMFDKYNSIIKELV